MSDEKSFYNPEAWRRVYLGKPVKDELLGKEALEKSTGQMIQDVRMKTGFAYSSAEIEFFAVRDLWEKMCRPNGGNK